MRPTGDPDEIRRLNNLLGRELGRNHRSEPVFKWEWSDNLFWPLFRTGRTTTVTKKMHVAVIGGGSEEVEVTETVPEYRRDRQVRLFATWYVTKWLPPWELITGPLSGHLRYGDDFGNKPPDAQVEAVWTARFPGTDFPSNGWRVPTNCHLPRSPHDPLIPTEPDTIHFIRCVKEQTSTTFDKELQRGLDAEDAKGEYVERQIGDVARDCFPAMLNPEPGKRGGFVSWPFSKIDRLR